MRMSSPVDGFRLAFDRHRGAGPAVVLLHGWPGDRTDHRYLAPLLDGYDVVVPDLRGFGESDKHPADPELYGAAAQARSVAALVEELGLEHVVVAGYDIGSRIGQTLARDRPELVSALVASPPFPGVGDRVLSARAQQEFWYQAFHHLTLAPALVDGKADAVREYLRHFWAHWSGPAFQLAEADLEHLVEVYSAPGAFTASIAWYRAGAGTVATALREQVPPPALRIGTPTTVLWPEYDPLFPRSWSDRLESYFTDVTVRAAEGVGHFTPVEAPERFAELIQAARPR
ncbi:MAG TPA: alpha/beta hydrolase [Pseudonocardia sp.]|jgi:pimeloyl-ACP methyl ester carboxylesterase